jgi:hypothetical protein
VPAGVEIAADDAVLAPKEQQRDIRHLGGQELAGRRKVRGQSHECRAAAEQDFDLPVGSHRVDVGRCRLRYGSSAMLVVCAGEGRELL